ADKAVAPLGLLVDRAERIGAMLNIGDREALEQGARIEIPGGLERGDLCIVVIAVADRFLENRGVRGDPAQSVLDDEFGQSAALQQIAADEVEPYRLSKFVKRP